jgi:hypothetical protein
MFWTLRKGCSTIVLFSMFDCCICFLWSWTCVQIQSSNISINYWIIMLHIYKLT